MLTAARRESRYLGLALGLLTRVPVPQGDCATAPGRSLHWYPAAGAVISALLLLCTWLPAPPLTAAALLLLLWVAISGGLHLDGLADCADAWVGGLGDRQRTLEILKDPACGPMGVSAIACALLLKFAVLASFDQQALYWLAAPIVARTLLPLAMVTTPYARTSGMASGLAESASRPAIGLTTALVALALALWLPSTLWWLWLAAALALYALWRRAVLRRLGGYTGDTAGALVEVAELVFLTITVLYAAAPE